MTQDIHTLLQIASKIDFNRSLSSAAFDAVMYGQGFIVVNYDENQLHINHIPYEELLNYEQKTQSRRKNKRKITRRSKKTKAGK